MSEHLKISANKQWAETLRLYVFSLIHKNFKAEKRNLEFTGKNQVKLRSFYAFCLSRFGGFTFAEISKQMSVSKRTISRYISRAENLLTVENNDIEYKQNKEFIEISKSIIEKINKYRKEILS